MIAKKRLGQNFLRDQAVVHKIISTLNLRKEEILLEIGCGRGALTRHLVGTTTRFIGIELDTELFTGLKREFQDGSTLFLNQDILTLHLEQLLHKIGADSTLFKVVGNIPYYISSPLVQWLTQQVDFLESATIMFQREVGERLSAMPGTKEYGLLSLLGQYYFQVSSLFTVKAGAFWPTPKVDSQVVRFTPLRKRILSKDKEQAFFAFLKHGFSQRRKILVNALKPAPIRGECLDRAMNRLGLSRQTRAEELSLQKLSELFLEIEREGC
ncbi:MAG: 16S rRNA (adenine(1518)-N(6)/adenine(1519)-N(6))-dimethyltransferase RsmA [Terriglobia bacterium]